MSSRILIGWAATVLAVAATATSLSARDAVRTVPLPASGAATPAATEPPPETPPGEAGRTRPTVPAAERATLAITVDRAKVIRLPERTQTVVIGNPAIADVAIQKNGIVVVTGKSYGTTNLIALDGSGNMLAESTVSVAASNDNVLVVQRGFERQTYSCTPACQPSVILGDANSYFSENRGQADARNAFAVSR